jgi:starch phosphorylase
MSGRQSPRWRMAEIWASFRRPESGPPAVSKKTHDMKAHHLPAPVSSETLLQRIELHLRNFRGRNLATASDYDKLLCLCHAIRDFALDRMAATEHTHTEEDVKRVYYLSMEFLIGRLLHNNITSLGLDQAVEAVLPRLQLDDERIIALKPDAGLGNGGLGRLAACFLDSLATLEYPGYGYGIRYEHGMFRQEFTRGWQMERPDDWLKFGYPWEIVRPEDRVSVILYGRLQPSVIPGGNPLWTDWQMIEGVPYDIPIIGYGVNTVNALRLWHSRAAEGFRLDVFNQGDYVRAVEEKNWAETVSKVLYPSENTHAGRELRLIQEYFLVACSLRDATRRHLARHQDLSGFATRNALQLNDTHPALAVAELMRILVDEHQLPWERAWEITVPSLGYTNHTLLPEALERWPVPLLQRVLPRHLDIIYRINQRFLDDIRRLPDTTEDTVRRLSIIEEGPVQQVRMANLAIVGSHAVNGVARLHSDLIRSELVPEFARLWPERFSNKTNGVTQRRWLLVCNPGLSHLVTEAIGPEWTRNLDHLRKLEPLAEDASFRARFLEVKHENKRRLAATIEARLGVHVDTHALFDVQIKRLHEYKRQLLNALHIVTLYHRLKRNPGLDIVPRVFVFGAKAAPGYHIAKRIIKFINSLGEVLAQDPVVRDRLRVVFLPDYNVSLAEIIIPAADLSEQISTAGKEASGTGNMKLALNGALTIGTWDGANIEIAEAVGLDNIFVCGHRAEDIARMRREGYQPIDWIQRDPELAGVIDAIWRGDFSPGEPGLFDNIGRIFTEWGDPYFHCADFRSYVDAQQQAADLFRDRDAWARTAILNVARIGYFSSDRAIREYADEIWGIRPIPVPLEASQASTSKVPRRPRHPRPHPPALGKHN